MAGYTLYHPKWYRPRVSTWWWMWKWNYLKFILRELTSLSVAYSVVILLTLLYCLSEGPAGYADFLDLMRSPLMIALSVLSFIFIMFHAISWFNLAPKAMTVRVGGRRVPGLLIALPNYVAWVAASAVIAWFILGGKF
ncbi:MAG TPA: fumarate reductase subunit C [Blastocatellia bacterium]|nr:fumarate reductase subunit C [Blastocatellia bacterium]